MEQFEKYHPLLTEHYTLDWLTTTSLKEVHQLLPKISSSYAWQNFSQSAQFLNQTMLTIMRNQQLVWGITRRSENTLVGVASLTHFTSEQVQLTLQPLPSDRHIPQINQETLLYLTAFVLAELAIPKIILAAPFPAKDLLTRLGYSYQADTNTWEIERAVQLPARD
ncbi:hypothetical protein [Lapidilactobacillus wuchangensis]|uniref:hypothetical protein n=1 Tax=Lapidilactobacillus wuchangensis TaxID=2486001 RepID=UPI000F7A9917|nr:hypothetical protein [Lapidilactobacillus wuchangensis]